MVTANASVDIPALKARHPLGDTVEASGVRLRGRGRVRQGVCPFHDEAEGSFTVYADSERFYCFGCGLGGDVLDFIRQSENLTLPEAIARLDGSPGLAPRAANRPARTRRPASAALPPRDPSLLTAAARFYAGRLRRSSEAREYLASRGVGPVAAARLGLGYSPGNGLRLALESLDFSEKRIRDSGLFTERGSERFAGMVVVPDPVSSTGQATGGLVRWLKGRAVSEDVKPRFQALPGPKPVLGLGRLGPAPSWVIVAEGVFDWLLLTGWGPPRLRRPGHPRRRARRLGPAGLPPRLPRLRLRRRGPGGDGAASDPARTQGRRRHPPPGRRRRGRACGPSPGPRRLPPPALAGCTLGPIAAPRRSPAGVPARLSLPHSNRPGGPMPIPRRAFARARLPVGEPAPSLIRYWNTLQGRRHEMSNGNNNGHSPNGVHKDTAPASSAGQAIATRNGNGHRPDAAIVTEHDLLWDGLPPAVTQALGQPIDPAAGLPAQGPRRSHLLLHRGPHRHLRGQQGLRLRRVGVRAGRERQPAPDRDGRYPDGRGEGDQRLHRSGPGHRSGRASPHRHRLPRRDGRNGGRA